MESCLAKVLVQQVEKGNNNLQPTAFAAGLKALNEDMEEVIWGFEGTPCSKFNLYRLHRHNN